MFSPRFFPAVERYPRTLCACRSVPFMLCTSGAFSVRSSEPRWQISEMTTSHSCGLLPASDHSTGARDLSLQGRYEGKKRRFR